MYFKNCGNLNLLCLICFRDELKVLLLCAQFYFKCNKSSDLIIFTDIFQLIVLSAILKLNYNKILNLIFNLTNFYIFSLNG